MIEWYINYAEKLENELIASVPAQENIVIYYEELFGIDQDFEARLNAMNKVLDVLSLAPPLVHEQMQLLLSPKSKYNDMSTLETVPNIQEIRDRFGKV